MIKFPKNKQLKTVSFLMWFGCAAFLPLDYKGIIFEHNIRNLKVAIQTYEKTSNSYNSKKP